MSLGGKEAALGRRERTGVSPRLKEGEGVASSAPPPSSRLAGLVKNWCSSGRDRPHSASSACSSRAVR